MSLTRQTAWRAPSRHFVAQNSTTLLALVILVFSVVAYLVLYYQSLGHFPDQYDLTTIIDTALPLAWVGLGQTIVVVTRGLDLSVGGVMSVAVALAASRMHDVGTMILWCVIVLLVGAFAGFVNGVLVAYAKLAPILVTLATLSIFEGIALVVLPQPGGQIPVGLTNVLTNPGHPYALIYLFLILGIWSVFRRTSLGTAIFATGNDETAATANGINVARATLAAYVLSGLFAAVAGLFVAAQTTAGDPGAGNPFVLTSIAAVFLGGATIFGGRAHALGTVCGALVLTLIVSVLFYANVNQLYQAMYEGLLLILAVLLGILVGKLARTSR